MLCSEASMVNSGWDGHQAVTLRCRSWQCPLCAETRKKQLIALANSGNPTTFITLTVNPAYFSSREHRARALVDAWRTLIKLMKAQFGIATIPYFCVFEAQKSGEPHLHILARIKYIPQQWLSDQMNELMGAPIVDIRRVKNQKKLTYYISKYCGKEPHRFATCKRYWTTRDYELTKFEPEPPPGRWDHSWRLERTPLDQLADLWTSEGYEVTRSRHRAVAWLQGPPEDEVTAYRYGLHRQARGLPW